MVGDAAVIPAIAASLARVRPGVPVHVLVAVDGPEEQQPLTTPGDLHLRWLPDDDALVAAVADLDFPAGRVHAFVHGEATAVREIRRHLLVDRALPREALSISGYWKRTRTEEGWREDKAEWNRLVEEDAGERWPRGPGSLAGVRPEGETRGIASYGRSRATCGSWSDCWSANSAFTCTESYSGSGSSSAGDTRMWSSACELPSNTYE
jgi:hypothetical protein